MDYFITIYSIILLLAILGAVGFVVFYIFSLMTHKDDPTYPGKKIVQGLIVFSLTWIFLLIFIPLTDIIGKYDLQDTFLGFSLNLENFYYTAIQLTVVICLLNIIAKNYYQSQESDTKKRVMKSVAQSGIYVGVYSGAVVLTYFLCAYLQYNRRIYLVTPRVFIMSYQMQSFLPAPSNLKEQILIDVSLEIASIAPFILLCMFYFSVYGAASFAIFPLEQIKNLMLAPSKLEPDFQVYSKQNLIQNGEELIEEGKRIYKIQRELDLGIIQNPREKSKRQKALKRDMILYKKRLFQYDEICEYYKEQENLDKANPIKHKALLASMFIGLIVSFSIFIQHFIMLSDNDFLLDDFFQNIEKRQPLLPHVLFIGASIYLVIAIAYSLKVITVYLPFFDEFFPFAFKRTYDDTFLEAIPIFIMSVFGFQLFMPIACDTYYSYTETSFVTIQIFRKVRYFKKIYESGLFLYVFVLIFTISMFISFFIMPARSKLEDMNYFLRKKEEQEKSLKQES